VGVGHRGAASRLRTSDYSLRALANRAQPSTSTPPQRTRCGQIGGRRLASPGQLVDADGRMVGSQMRGGGDGREPVGDEPLAEPKRLGVIGGPVVDPAEFPRPGRGDLRRAKMRSWGNGPISHRMWQCRSIIGRASPARRPYGAPPRSVPTLAAVRATPQRRVRSVRLGPLTDDPREATRSRSRRAPRGRASFHGPVDLAAELDRHLAESDFGER